VLVAVAVVGLVVGLVVWAPWHQVPVAPAAVHAQSPTATSVLVSWDASKGGATVDRYLILRDGTQVGSVPASSTSYLDGGLTPGASYRYTIVAVSGTQRSTPSVKADVTTITPSPVGLTANQTTWTTSTIRWSASPKGPVPAKYLIYRGGTLVTALTGTTISYAATGLTPATTYQYQVAAQWGSKTSGLSAPLAVATLTQPLQGPVPVKLKTTSTPGGGASLKVGQSWSDSWSFSSACTGNQCTLTATAEFAIPGFSVTPWTMTLVTSDGGYYGSTRADVTECSKTNVDNSITMRINADNGAVRNGAWNSWNGTLTLSSPYTTVGGGYYCPSQSWQFAVTGS
jgi:hypothetical protein